MNKQELFDLILKKRSFLCVGLDSDIDLIPRHLLDFDDPVFEFNKAIIDATIQLVVAYKPNMAFYESRGLKGWQSLEHTMEYLQKFKGEVFTIADAKRGDIGNTSKMYAKAFFEWLKFDSVTVAPYMGEDSVKPFLEYEGKWVILLGLTSNKGSADFQFLETGKGKLYETVISKAQTWAGSDRLMFVIGATHPEQFKGVRQLAPDNFYLVPGVGAQGGDMQKICENGLNSQCGLLINSARNIIYASNGDDFATKARAVALEMVEQMQPFIARLG
ncbi:MAG TPA: orotidine-5'-phosphate decarboxylase [Chitinophagales bacterium]|nr:orotidine-5'-phosphate decarboxylase [Chitinophagales bacterium]